MKQTGRHFSVPRPDLATSDTFAGVGSHRPSFGRHALPSVTVVLGMTGAAAP